MRTGARSGGLSSVRPDAPFLQLFSAKSAGFLHFLGPCARHLSAIRVRLCKNEVVIIWGDYFKAPQIEKFPDVHHVVHQIMMAASKTKQEPSREVGVKLVELVNDFAQMFWESKGVKTKRLVCPYPPSLKVVYPELG